MRSMSAAEQSVPLANEGQRLRAWTLRFQPLFQVVPE